MWQNLEDGCPQHRLDFADTAVQRQLGRSDFTVNTVSERQLPSNKTIANGRSLPRLF